MLFGKGKMLEVLEVCILVDTEEYRDKVDFLAELAEDSVLFKVLRFCIHKARLILFVCWHH